MAIMLKGEHVCITGTLDGMTRSEAFTRLKLAGGVPCERFTSKVTLFVIAADAGRSKREKAEKAIESGQKVRIVSGDEFVAALNESGKTPREKEERMEKKQGKKMQVFVAGKQLLAMKCAASKDESRRILMGIRVEGDYEGRWRMVATDSYRLLMIETNVPPSGEFAFTLPPEAMNGVKPSDLVVLTYDSEKQEVNMVRELARRRGRTEVTLKEMDGKYPNYQQLVPFDDIPVACYRPALFASSEHVGAILKAMETALGAGAQVEMVTQEDATPEKPKAAMLYAEGETVRIRGLVMPLRYTRDSSFLAKARPVGKFEERNKELRKEVDVLKANVDMWKAKALEADKDGDGEKVKALEAERDELMRERDKFVEKYRAEKAKRVEEKGDGKLEERVKELEAQLKAARKELDEVWKENAALKAKPRAQVPPAPEPPKSTEDTAAAVSLETIRAWCEGKGLVASQKGEGCCIWVEGESKPYADELKGMGFRFAKKRRSWYRAA